LKKKLKSEGNRLKNKSTTIKKINIILIVIVVISLIILTLQIEHFYFLKKDSNPQSQLTLPEGPIYLPLPSEGIINVGEHVNHFDLGEKWIEVMDQTNESSTIMIGTPDLTFTSNPKSIFSGIDENNIIITKLAIEYPGRFVSFPTVDPFDPEKNEKFEDLLFRGAKGLNLWTGHNGTLNISGELTSFHEHFGQLNCSNMEPIYQLCENESIPIVWSLNLGVRCIRNEFEQVLKMHPNLIINIPHMGICVRHHNFLILEYFFEKYQNLYTDISFGSPAFLKYNFELISSNVLFYKPFFNKYQDRIMFGTDLVLNKNTRKTVEWMVNTTEAYKNLISKPYYFVTIHNLTGEGWSWSRYLYGLNLGQEIVDKIFYNNTMKFLKGKFFYEELNLTNNETRSTRSQVKKDNSIMNYFSESLLVITGSKKILIVNCY
jgi:predicted TIM-barrel fold metal-dependent hydrolase